jgi:hypothetical protein
MMEGWNRSEFVDYLLRTGFVAVELTRVLSQAEIDGTAGCE